MRRDGLDRLIDASGNRAREGVRVLEDLARFVLDDRDLAGSLKAARHEVAGAVSDLGFRGVAARDTAGDVGTELGTDAEYERPGIVAVAEAAGGRATEAVRALEEIAKTVPGGDAGARRLEAVRYRLYDLVAATVAGLSRGRPVGWRVQVLLTEAACRRPWREVLDEVVAGGADAVQVREKDFGPAALVERVREVVEVARPAGVAVIVNDRADVAAAAGADGVHLGQDDLPVEVARRVVGRLGIVGGSSHMLEEAARLVAAGCDYAGVGRFAASGTKPGATAGGAAFVRAFVEAHPRMPHLVIGGVGPSNVGEVIAAGGRAVAVCESVCGAENPASVVADLRLRLQHAVAEDLVAEAAGSGAA
jgi:thiamine-phosphate pyrophosphorylase